MDADPLDRDDFDVVAFINSRCGLKRSINALIPRCFRGISAFPNVMVHDLIDSSFISALVRWLSRFLH
jgi:hypothetical protein